MTSFNTATSATVQETVRGNSLQGDYTRIYHTSDGGRTWVRSVIDASALETPPVFVDDLHGWALLTSNFPGVDPGSAYIGKEITLYRTSDGGKNWQSIASGPATSQLGVTSDDAYGVPPLTASTRMTFVNASIGWLAGTSSHSDNSEYSWLCVTHDGGMTWKQATIVLTADSLIFNPPTFFTERDALLPVFTSGPAPQYTHTSMLFTTHDGGQTWAGMAIPFDITVGGLADVRHGWAPIDSENQAIYMTTDGWLHWMKKHIDVAFKRVHMGKLLVARSFRREPEVLPPRFELVGTQNPPDRFGRDSLNQTISLELAGQFRVPRSAWPTSERGIPLDQPVSR